mgnify:CR=1 FL=1
MVIVKDSEWAVVSAAIRQTWQAIGHEMLVACQEAGERCDNETAIECCIDCDRLPDYGGKDGNLAQRYLRSWFKKYDYNEILSYCSRRIRL